MAIKRPSASSVLTLVVIAGLTTAAMMLGGPPPPAPSSAPVTEFSAERAMSHVVQIAQRPHPLGSIDHERVRDYLVTALKELGLQVNRQTTTAVRPVAGGAVAASVENLLVRMKGTASTGAILLASHYDSVPAAPGAADDGSGVAAMLETLRALKASPPLRNDVIALFSDAEELGLLGAEGFVREHAWAKDVRFAVNLEARGTSGPSMMFETGPGNGIVVREWAAAAPYPSGSSLTYEVYKRLPNDTDFSVFRRLGVAGLNFAFIGNWRAYHSPLDSVVNLDKGSLQHHGAAAHALVRAFGGKDLTALSDRDAVYFSLPIVRVVVSYSTLWALPLAASAVILFVCVAVISWRRQNTSIGGMLLALIFWLVLGAAAGLWSYYFSRGIGWMHARWLGPGDLLRSWPYAFALVMSVVTAGLFVYPLLRRKFAGQTLALSGLFLCLIAVCTISLMMAGGSYVLLWPLLAGLLAVVLLPPAIEYRRTEVGPARMCIIWALALPSTLILWPLASMLFESLGLAPVSGAGIGVLTVLAMFTLAPQIDLLGDRTRFWPAVLALLVTLASLGVGMRMTGDSAEQPRTVNVTFVLDAAKREAFWVTRTAVGHPWLRQFFGDSPRQGRPAALVPPWLAKDSAPDYISQSVEPVDLGAPNAVLVSGGERQAVGRSIVIRVTPATEAHTLSVWLSGASVLEARINGRDVNPGGASIESREDTWTLDYGNAPAAGITIALTLKSAGPVAIGVLDRNAGWPVIPGRSFAPRPPELMPSQWGDQTVVRRDFTF